MKKLPFVFFALGLTAILATAVVQIAVAQANSEKTFTLYVAQDLSTVAVNFADFPGPGRGDSALINGTIYEEPLPSGVTDFDPTTAGIGTWRCLFAGLGPDEAPLVGAVTYYFALKENGEESMLIVQGLNSHFVGSDPRNLAIVGGTGKFSGATGEVVEEVIGTNATGALNLRYTFTLKKQAPK